MKQMRWMAPGFFLMSMLFAQSEINQSKIEVPAGASITVPITAYICADTIKVLGTFTYYISTSVCVEPIGSGGISDIQKSTVKTISSATINGSYKIGDVIPIDISFDESVTVTGTPQLTLETGDTNAVADYASGSGSTTLTFNYTVASGHSSNDLEYVSTTALTLNGGTITDAPGNAALLTLPSPGTGTSLSSTKDIVVDGIIPTLSSLSPLDGATNASPNSNFILSFSENVVSGKGELIIKDNYDVEYESISASSDKISISGNVATVNPAKDMKITTPYYVTLDSGMFKDVAGNEYVGITGDTTWNFTTSAEADVIAPSVASAVVSDGDSVDVDTQNTTTSIIANWSGFTDEVGIASYDWGIGTTSGGTEIKDWTAVGNITTVADSTLSLTNGYTYYVSVRAVDGSGNQSDVVPSDGVTVEVAGPIPTLSSSVTTATNSSPITFTVVFSSAVTGFESTDLTIGNGSIGVFAGSDTSYSFNVTPTAEGKVTVDIGADVATDSAGLGNPDIQQFSIVYDVTNPTVGLVNDGAANDIDYQISLTTFQANWSGFKDNLSGISKYEWSIQYSSGLFITKLLEWTETGLDTTAMDSTLTFEEDRPYFTFIRATDYAGNISQEAFSDGFIVTQNAPTATFSADAVDATNDSTFTVYVNFSDNVSGFDQGDIVISNGTADAFTGSGKEYSFEATPIDEGKVIITVGDGIAKNPDGIGNIGGQFTMVYDITKPLAGLVIDGRLEDLNWSSDVGSLTATWTGFTDSLSGIGNYEYSIGKTSGAKDVLGWTIVENDTTVTATELTLEDGTTYYTTVHAIDRAGNVSPDTTSTGVTVDTSPPKAGIINDGESEDLDRTSSLTSLSANWTEFKDQLSGVAFYEYAIGITPGDTSFVDWTTTGLNTFYSRDDFTLEADSVYYHSVRARDVVGNISDPIVSDGITMDQSPPAILAVSPDEELLLSLTVSEVIIIFTEPIDTFELTIDSDVMEDFVFDIDHLEDSILVTLPPIASMDSLTFTFRNVTDLVGFVTDEINLGFKTAILADYNSDEKIDVSDLNLFTQAWINDNIFLELGPTSGEVPHLIPSLDSTLDIWDIAAFTRMWHWSHTNTTYIARALPNVGNDINVQQSRQSLAVSIPDEAMAGEVLLSYGMSGVDITLTDGKTPDRILIKDEDEDLNQLVVDFGYLKTVEKKQLTFDVKYETSIDPIITISYIFYGRENTIISMGTRELDLTAVPDAFAIFQNYPNPFNPITTILYDLPEAAKVHLVIYDVLGRQVRTLVNQDLTPGYHRAVWDATDDLGRPLSGGLYIYRIQAGGFSKTMKMVQLK